MPGVGAIGGLTPQVPVIPANREEEARAVAPTGKEEEKVEAVVSQPRPREDERAEPAEVPTEPQGVGNNLDMTA